MRWVDFHRLGVLVSIAVVTAVSADQQRAPLTDFGRQPTAEEIRLWDIDVSPDGAGLPEGRGTVLQGKEVYANYCAACHGEQGEGGIKDRLVGGRNTLTTANPVKTVGSYWPYATTLFDYIRRAMPYGAPGILSPGDTYSVTAYILNLNGIVADDDVLDARSLPRVIMPNRDGFTPDPEFSSPPRNVPRTSKRKLPEAEPDTPAQSDLKR